jgi:hypothetical protein
MTLRRPPPLAALLDAGCDLTKIAGLNLDDLALAYWLRAERTSEQRASTAEQFRRSVEHSLTRPVSRLPGIEQAALAATAWIAELVEDDDLAMRLFPTLCAHTDVTDYLQHRQS